MRLTGNFKKIPKKNFWELLLSPVVEKVVFVFLSLRYGADLGRSRLVVSIMRQENYSTELPVMKNEACKKSTSEFENHGNFLKQTQ